MYAWSRGFVAHHGRRCRSIAAVLREAAFRAKTELTVVQLFDQLVRGCGALFLKDRQADITQAGTEKPEFASAGGG
jgi:hypothetical protein